MAEVSPSEPRRDSSPARQHLTAGRNRTAAERHLIAESMTERLHQFIGRIPLPDPMIGEHGHVDARRERRDDLADLVVHGDVYVLERA